MPLCPWYIWELRELKSSNTGTCDLKSLQHTTVKERRAERFSKQTNNVRTEKEINGTGETAQSMALSLSLLAVRESRHKDLSTVLNIIEGVSSLADAVRPNTGGVNKILLLADLNALR